MGDTTVSLRRKIVSAGDLQSVVRTMKAVAASSIGQYEEAVRALGEYYRNVELGLGFVSAAQDQRRQLRESQDERLRARSARSCLAQTRDWLASLTIWWLTMQLRP